MTESSHMVGIRGSFDLVLIPFSSFSPFSILGGPPFDRSLSGFSTLKKGNIETFVLLTFRFASHNLKFSFSD